MKKHFFQSLGCLVLLTLLSCTTSAEKVTIKGKVAFFDPNFKLTLTSYQGNEPTVIAETEVNPDDSTYTMTFGLETPGVYYLDCGKWQMVAVWLDNGNELEVDFRGKDTARMPIKNPPFVFIKGGGRNNELMNRFNYDEYRNYQMSIGVSQAAYRAPIATEQEKLDFSVQLYDIIDNELYSRYEHYMHEYADCNSWLYLMPRLEATEHYELIDKILAIFDKRDPNYAPYVKAKKDMQTAAAQRKLLEIGQSAPVFSYKTPDGSTLGLESFRGKFLVIDFWASWCGPCRGEIPSMKKIYAEFKNKDVEFLSVSIDKEEDMWKKALKEETMTWPQMLAPESGKEIMEKYQFSGVPYIILLDKEGKILAKGLRGEGVKDALVKAMSK